MCTDIHVIRHKTTETMKYSSRIAFSQFLANQYRVIINEPVSNGLISVNYGFRPSASFTALEAKHIPKFSLGRTHYQGMIHTGTHGTRQFGTVSHGVYPAGRWRGTCGCELPPGVID